MATGWPDTVAVGITPADIDLANQYPTYGGPLEKALDRILPDAEHIYVSTYSVWIDGEVYSLPDKGTQLVDRFNKGMSTPMWSLEICRVKPQWFGKIRYWRDLKKAKTLAQLA